jgi:hypothetical protein
MDRELRLTAELVPSSTWYRNLRSAVPRETWDRIRRSTYRAYGYRCGICGARGRLNRHEVWAYDDAARVQTLSGFVALCDWCHHAKHLMHAAGLASEGKLDYGRVVQHFMRVNGCDRRTFEEHRERALQEFQRRSEQEWRVDLGEYEHLASG